MKNATASGLSAKVKTESDFTNADSAIRELYELLKPLASPHFGERGASFKLTDLRSKRLRVLARLELRGSPNQGIPGEDTLWVSAQAAHSVLPDALAGEFTEVFDSLKHHGEIDIHVKLSSLSPIEFKKIRGLLGRCFADHAATAG